MPIGAAQEDCATSGQTVGALHVELRHGRTTSVALHVTVWRRVPPCRGSLQDIRPQLHVSLLEVEPGRDTECSGLIGQEAYTGPGPPLPIERQERDLVGQVVDEERDVPSASPNACAQVEQVV